MDYQTPFIPDYIHDADDNDNKHSHALETFSDDRASSPQPIVINAKAKSLLTNSNLKHLSNNANNN